MNTIADASNGTSIYLDPPPPVVPPLGEHMFDHNRTIERLF
jgi:hypothetical protein